MDVHSGELGVITEMNVDVPMRDGVKLRANVWRPDASGEVPGLLIRTPYGKSKSGYERFVRAGYAVVCQDARGRYDSAGEYTLYTLRTSDPEDGYDSVEWLASQPWCNARVGTMGASYVGWMQWMTAKTRPPHLVAMCARSIPLENTAVDWRGAFRPGRRLQWWFTTIAPDLRKRAGLGPPHTPGEAREIWDEIEHGRWLGTLPLMEVTQYLPPPLNQYARDWMLHPNRRCWRFNEAHAEIEVPNLDFTGWFDHCNSLGHLAGMQGNGRTELARTQTKVIVGPWAHGTIGKRECFGIDFGAGAQLDTQDLEIRWFDHWLKGLENGVEREPAVRYFVMGSGKWKSASTWPPPGLVEHTLHLASDGQANHPDGAGRLVAEPVTDQAADSYRYDPRDPVPTLWTRRLMAGATDRRRLAYRRDILIYRTAALEEEMEIAGSSEVVLCASSSAVDTDFFAWLVDEDPEGPALEVCYGMVRARHRHSWDHEELLTPGEVTEFRIQLGPTACRFRQGHCIRLDISSSDFPNFDRNHNTGKNDLLDAELLVAHQRVYHSTVHPSRLIVHRVDDNDE